MILLNEKNTLLKDEKRAFLAAEESESRENELIVITILIAPHAKMLQGQKSQKAVEIPNGMAVS